MSAPTLPLGVPSRVRVLVVDDNDGFRESLASLVDGEDMEIIGQACSGPEAIEMVRSLAPDVVLMDVRMPEMDGIEATRRLKALRPTLGVVALTGFEEQRAVRDMLVAGASGYVLKDSDGDEILNAIRRAASGGALLSSEVTPTVIEELIESLERERRRTRQLEIAQEALLERAARRQQLIGRVGHELRTPVTVILGLAQSLQRGGMSHEQFEEVLDTLVSRAEGLARLVRRFEAAVEAGLTEWANVTDLALEVAEREPRVSVDAPASPVMTTLNRTAGSRILEELVENALAFSAEETEVTIKISAPVPGTSPQVRVIDRGPGIEPHQVLRIFEPLEQAQDLHTRTHPGVGLGLSLARLSARAMDGDVVLESTGPEGSTFLWTVAPGAEDAAGERV
ncbi:MAG TPA: response regulator [Actinomycetota bacterium]|nr:response regulator [Actinomycetota bacterium]